MGQSIFIGYRRSDTADVSGRLYDALSLAFGEGKVFKDVDSIPVGADFAAHIKSLLPKCRVFLALIGPDWVSDGGTRLNDPTDLVRIEIETALNTPRLLVVPVLVNGARMPAEAEVPESLRPLLQRHAAIIRSDPDFKSDVARLVQALRDHLRTGRLNLQSLGGAARVAANAAGLSGWVVLVWLAVAGVGVTAAVPQLRQPIIETAMRIARPAQSAAETSLPPAATNPAPTEKPTAASDEPAPLPRPAASAPQNLGDGLSVILVSLAHQPGQYGDGRYIATLRFQNSTDAEVGIAVLSGGAFRGEMALTDGLGGSCSMAANGEGWGTMDTAEALDDPYTFGGDSFQVIPAGGQTQQTIFFNEGRCDTDITSETGLSISGSFVLKEGVSRRSSAVFFGDLAVVRP
ncbi:TIR domain-containing protein [Terricaulis sp.]|uniref:toll/interleukin-1 receptor domain-containing protein n=1 Tax=Terricaulis sp. TaxID=2768686 RepID=UPI0037844A40